MSVGPQKYLFVYAADVVFMYRGLAFVLTGRPRNDDARWFRACAKLTKPTRMTQPANVEGSYMTGVGQYALTGSDVTELEAALDLRSPNFHRIALLGVTAIDDLPWELHAIYDADARRAATEAYSAQRAAL